MRVAGNIQCHPSAAVWDRNFSPPQLGNLALWLDGFTGVLNSVAPDVIATNGQSVRRWLDVSGNARHVEQTTLAQQPTWNGAGFLSFDGLNDSMFNFGAALMRNISAATCYLVARRQANNATEAAGFYVLTNSNTRAALTFRNSGIGNTGMGAGGRRLAANGFQGTGADAYTANRVIGCAVFNFGAATLSFRQNLGAFSVRDPFQTAGLTENDAGTLWIGANAGLSFLNGEICSVLIYHAAHTAAQQARVVEYLRRRFSVIV